MTEDLFRYDGKRVLVVGCATGMGASTARIVQSLGGEVHGVDYREPDAQLAGFTQCDLRDPAQVEDMLGSLTGTFDSVFYCAGLPTGRPPLDIMKVNLAAMRLVVDGVISRVPHGGSISIISSTGGMNFLSHMGEIMGLLATDGFDGIVRWSEENPELVADGYVFSKEAVIVYTMMRALTAAADGVRVNCISPGPTDTPMMSDFEASASRELLLSFTGPMGRYATADEMAWPLAFLGSAAATYITGLNLIIDGGFLAGVMTGAIDIAALMPQPAEPVNA
jgi:NAD(P)-dependent dehydrogenase (short-subunit alcohol dehydrogenase family)